MLPWRYRRHRLMHRLRFCEAWFVAWARLSGRITLESDQSVVYDASRFGLRSVVAFWSDSVVRSNGRWLWRVFAGTVFKVSQGYTQGHLQKVGKVAHPTLAKPLKIKSSRTLTSQVFSRGRSSLWSIVFQVQAFHAQ